MMEHSIVKAHNTAGLQHSTISELVDGIGQTSKANAAHCYTKQVHDMGVEWFGLPDIDQTVDAINHGWSEGVDKVMQATNDLQIDIESTCIKRRRRRSDFGDEIDMQSVYAGDIDRAWTTTARQRTSAPKQLTVNIDLGANCQIKSDALFWRGAAALYLADKLTDSGYQVAINGCYAIAGVAKGRRNSGVIVPIKRREEPLNLPSLAATVCLAGFLRSALFYRILRNGFVVKPTLGRSIDFDATYGEKGEGIIDGFKTINSKQSALEFIHATIAGLE